MLEIMKCVYEYKTKLEQKIEINISSPVMIEDGATKHSKPNVLKSRSYYEILKAFLSICNIFFIYQI